MMTMSKMSKVSKPSTTSTACRSLAVASAVMAMVAAGCGKPATEEVDTETVIPVTTAPARLGTIRAVIQVTGASLF